jgi:SAM-dependent methyltransferase
MLSNAWAYIRYFIFIARHWDIRLAAFVVYHEIKGEHKYKTRSTGIDTLHSSLSAEDLQHASIYQPVSFYIAELLFQQLPFHITQTGFLDAGCGKGRTMAMAAYHGFKQIEGIDLSAAMIAHTNTAISSWASYYPHASFHAWQQNAMDVQVPLHTSVIFLFNPFDAFVMQAFVKRVAESLQQQPREMYVLYCNPLYKDIWEAVGFESIFHSQKMHYLEGAVLHFLPK